MKRPETSLRLRPRLFQKGDLMRRLCDCELGCLKRVTLWFSLLGLFPCRYPCSIVNRRVLVYAIVGVSVNCSSHGGTKVKLVQCKTFASKGWKFSLLGHTTCLFPCRYPYFSVNRYVLIYAIVGVSVSCSSHGRAKVKIAEVFWL
ncbi:hypothetical protein GOP47_0022565 [Adiantum capillus-veneris]|uniref:Uncharacterized protein n=1 Tax=Adiantum capillus-veneris TaxID=13818 RepID=A0A9D4U7Z7_ADICA|nr:hypothetical protein GOP47_0022565 [Adiantum capillus-veneris]